MNSASKYTPFTFSTSFDELEQSDLQLADEEKKRDIEDEVERARIEEEEANAPPPPPTFSEEEMMEAKAAAYAEGHTAGCAETLNDIEHKTLGALQTITGHLAVIQDKQSLANESQAASLARIASGLVRRMMPRYEAAHGTEEIAALVYESLAPLESKGRIKITIPADLKDTLEEKIKDVSNEAGFEGRIIYTASETMGPSDIRIDWGRGSAERRISHALSDMDSIVENFMNNHQQALEISELDAMDIPDQTPAEDTANEAPSSTVDENDQIRTEIETTNIENTPTAQESELQKVNLDMEVPKVDTPEPETSPILEEKLNDE